MIPWIELDTATVPGDGATLRLMRRGDEFTISIAGAELMNSRRGATERALAEGACARLGARPGATILVGGLGMGFTLRAALAASARDAAIVVAEIVPGVVRWARGPLAPLFAGSLDDPRVRLVEDDVGRVIRASPAAFDAILLDVDNGPEALTRRGNDGLYDARGLAASRAALRPGGVLGVWSAAPDARFAQRLRASGFRVDEARLRAPGGRYVLWFATRSRDGAAAG